MDNNEGCFTPFLLVMGCLLIFLGATKIGYQYGESSGIQQIRVEAIDREFGQWDTDKFGETVFKWKGDSKEQGEI